MFLFLFIGGNILFYVVKGNAAKQWEGFYLLGDDWDDFTFKTNFQLSYVNSNLEEEFIGFTKIGYRRQLKGYTKLSGFFTELPEKYFSLGQDVEFYSNLKNLGPKLREECLKGLNDLAYNTAKFEQVEDERVVIDSLLRNVNRRVIRNQFNRIAHGGAILTDYNFEYQLSQESQNGTFYFDVHAGSLPPSNIHTIIGTNGSGKTTALTGIIDEYLNDNLEEEFSNCIFISFSVFDKGVAYESTDAGKDYHYVGVKTIEGKTKSQGELKEEFANSIEGILSKRRYDYIIKMLGILQADNNLESFGLLDQINNFMKSSKNKEEIIKCSASFGEIFNQLSSGHQIILMSITKVVELIVEKTLILIDEPETHLHPPLLSALIRALSEMAISENAVAILATHSPVVLQEVPKSCVSIIRKYRNQINIQRPRFETFGENVAALTEEVFGLEIPKTGFHTLLRNEVSKNSNYDDIVELFNNELSIEAKSIIRTYINEEHKDKM